MNEIESFHSFLIDKLASGEELPCDPDVFTAVLAWEIAAVPEFKLARQDEAAASEDRQAERKRAALDGFRRARGAPPMTQNGNGGNGNSDTVNPPEAA